MWRVWCGVVCDCYQSICAVQRESVSPHPPYTWYVATSQPRTLHWDTSEGWEGKLKQLSKDANFFICSGGGGISIS